MLPYDGQVGLSECVVLDQFVLSVRQRQQTVAISRREDGTAGHQCSSEKKKRMAALEKRRISCKGSFSKTEVFKNLAENPLRGLDDSRNHAVSVLTNGS